MMDELRIHTHIHNRYQVFDASGRLPFSIVFGLCRSVLDVPYALAHGLLTLHGEDPEDAKRWVEVDLSRLNKVIAKEAGCLSLRPQVNRTGRWRDALTVYQRVVDVDGELASILEPGKKYIIRLASKDLGVKRWAYSDRKQSVDDDGKPSHDPEAVRLVNSKRTGGNAMFTVVQSLPWPPRMETRMRLRTSSPSSVSATANVKPGSSGTALEVSVVNTGPDPGHRTDAGDTSVSWCPGGPFQPEADADDRTRIIDATAQNPPTSSLQVVDSATGEAVRGNRRCGPGPLPGPNADRRAEVEDVLTLKPGGPVVREIDVGALVHGLADGQYTVRMRPKGCRWWRGEVGGEEEEAEDGRVPAHLGGIRIPPLMLESQDEVELRIRDGKVDRSM